ncbi:MAG: hypothetical protein HRF49_11490 [bacterium]
MKINDYADLRRHVGKNITCTYDTGAAITGELLLCKPASGPVLVVVMKNADICAPDGSIIEHHPGFSFVPNVQVGIEAE